MTWYFYLDPSEEWFPIVSVQRTLYSQSIPFNEIFGMCPWVEVDLGWATNRPRKIKCGQKRRGSLSIAEGDGLSATLMNKIIHTQNTATLK